MKKILISFIIAIFCLTLTIIPASAEEYSTIVSDELISENRYSEENESKPISENKIFVVDNADVLTDEEEKDLNEKCKKFAEEFNAEIAIVTITDLEGKDKKEYADDFYDKYGYGYGENKDGLLLLYLDAEEGSRKIAVSTKGSARDNITNDESDLLINEAISYLENGDYKEAFDNFIEKAGEAIEPMPAIIWLLICLAVGLVIGLIITNRMIASNYSVSKKFTASDYVRQGSLIVTGSNDMFVSSTVRTTPKANSSGSNNSKGTEVTHASSDSSHGGGSATF